MTEQERAQAGVLSTFIGLGVVAIIIGMVAIMFGFDRHGLAILISGIIVVSLLSLTAAGIDSVIGVWGGSNGE